MQTPDTKLQEIVTETVEQKDMVTINMNNLRYRVDRNSIICTRNQCIYPKIDALIFMLLRSSEKTIVFTNVTKMLSHIECRLMEEKIPFVSSEVRKKLRYVPKRFNAFKTIPIRKYFY